METATKWLFDKLWDTPKDKLTWYAILQEAEKMHEKQIKDAYGNEEYDENGCPMSAEKYYNQTYIRNNGK